MQIYDKLLGIPLFQGMSSSDLQDVVSSVKFDFQQYVRGRAIVSQGMPCKRLYVVLEGEVELVRESDGVRISEYVHAPCLLQPENLFGINQRYTCSCIASQRCSTLSLSKTDVSTLMSKFLVFRLNVLNMLCMLSQRQSAELSLLQPMDVRALVMQFLRQHCITPVGKKVFRMKMTTLAECIGQSRLDVSVALNALAGEGLIVLQRGIITINDMSNLQ